MKRRRIGEGEKSAAYELAFDTYLHRRKKLRLSKLTEDEKVHYFQRFKDKWNAGELSDAYYQMQQLPSTAPRRVMGPTMPDMADLERRTEMKIAAASWQRKIVDKRFKAQKKETENEIAPRAEAGTRERRLEKKADVNTKMQSFRDKSPDAAVSQEDLMGKPDEYRTMLLQQKDRAQQRDDLQRAMRSQREKEMDFKREQARLKEERAMDMIREMARQKYDA